MNLPAGQVLVGAVGLAIIGFGIFQLYRAWTEGFADKLDGEGRSGKTGTAYIAFGKAGYTARGVAFVDRRRAVLLRRDHPRRREVRRARPGAVRGPRPAVRPVPALRWSASASSASGCSPSPRPGTCRDDGDRSTVDVVVLGLGAGGEYAARKLAEAGLDVVGVERDLVGGECPFWGCTPSKLLIHSARTSGQAACAPGGRPDPRGQPRLARRRSTPARSRRPGCGSCAATAGSPGPGRVEVDGTTYDARLGVVLDTGTEPAVPADRRARRHAVLDQPRRDAADRRRRRRWSCSAAGRSARAGAGVRAVRHPGHAARGAGPAARPGGARGGRGGRRAVLRADGVEIRVGVEVTAVRHDGGFVLDVDGETLSAEQLLVAAGRRLNLDDIGLETVGPRPGRRPRSTPTSGCGRGSGCGRSATSPARARSRTSRSTRRRSRCATCSARTARGPTTAAVSRVTFTDPEVGSVGLTEEQARDGRRSGWPSATPTSRGPAAAGSTRRRGSSRWSHATPTAACWSAAPSWRRTAARCSACSPRPCTPRSRSRRCAGCTSPTRPSTARSRRRWATSTS